jgi:hypothetical protein
MPRPAAPLEYLRRFEIQNHAFGDDVRIEGVMISSEPSFVIGAAIGGVSIVISQPWLDARYDKRPHPAEEEVGTLLRARGFAPVPEAFFGWRRQMDGLLVLDARPDNFIKTAVGILPIDLQFAEQPDG